MSNLPPHVLIFPFPAQGHINSMLNLAELLSLSGLHVTFIITEHYYPKLIEHSTVLSRFKKYNGFRFQTIWDGLPEQASRSGSGLFDMYFSMKLETKRILKDMLVSSRLGSDDREPVTSIIGDGIMGLVLEVGEDVGIPVFYFRTISACCFWAYLCMPRLVDAGELPLKGNDLDVLIENIPSMEGFLRRRDLPSFCCANDLSDPAFQMVLTETSLSTRAHGLILNTFEDLEGPTLSEIRAHCPKLYTIGPISAHLDARLGDQSTTFSNSLVREDKSCLKWLDSQPSRSVIYVSFGSIATMTWTQLLEFWYGLVNSEQRFLWVRRIDTIAGGDEDDHHIPKKLLEGTVQRGYIVKWAPQQEVLSHKAVGGFLTHSGWNSTLESVVAGVPMICWPFFADQQINSRFVDEIWKVGLDMKDVSDRETVEKMVRDVMVVRKDEFVGSARRMAQMARAAVNEGGSSYSDFDGLIEDIRLTSTQSSASG